MPAMPAVRGPKDRVVDPKPLRASSTFSNLKDTEKSHNLSSM